MKRKIKPFWIRLGSPNCFRLNEVIKTSITGDGYLVIKDKYIDKKWKKLFRSWKAQRFFGFFGIDIHDHTGCIKVKSLSK